MPINDYPIPQPGTPVTFSEVQVGAKFRWSGVEFVKIDTIRHRAHPCRSCFQPAYVNAHGPRSMSVHFCENDEVRVEEDLPWNDHP